MCYLDSSGQRPCHWQVLATEAPRGDAGWLTAIVATTGIVITVYLEIGEVFLEVESEIALERSPR